ncbi:hypothetical protein ACFOLJ_03115 [Rugamonas sp. CCM 8940]|nr:hypothetical protein [Rugamonas sp. CCM 8940]MBJ7311930.1 hypothetical protein [Rugamonas sp. CCM 8940]
MHHLYLLENIMGIPGISQVLDIASGLMGMLGGGSPAEKEKKQEPGDLA